MLQRLGDPAARKGTLTDMNDRLINYLIHCHLQLIILDDFHHLIDSETDHVLQAVSDWLKVLIKESGVPFLVVGIEHKVQRILEANSQLSRLFPVREMLEPLQWLATDTKRTREFAAFVNIMEKQIGLPLAPNVARAELLTRLHYATDGVVGNLMNLIRFSTLSAVQQNVQHIEMAILAATFDKYLSKHLMDKVNPFDASWGATFIAPNRTFYDRPEATGNRSRQRKKHVRTANELLKTS